ncbi:TadE/TadG family type IV pilus assembly protein [Neoactinobaculum massilliense]|uniref:TadE/TadG family type IV pilus assembly protein n=1 Tax=Neoactinobaculum massilliense TaxID=2364794 RepID=UPI000F546BD5|nr:TadE/TadG family type IV pilus assembly protein [Neoactinobaculum massilliense]
MFPRKRTSRENNSENGNAVVEFIGVLIVLFVPLMIAVVDMAVVLDARAAATSAARDAGRVYVRAASDAQGRDSARLTAHLVLSDRGIGSGPVTFTCRTRPCLSPGNRVMVTVEAHAPLPYLGRTVAVTGHVIYTVDLYREVRP